MTPEEPRIRVLLADDSRPMRSLIRSVFPPGPGCPEFHEVANGEEAVAAYRQRRYDIVILDIRMPVLDGLEALADIRAYDEDAFVVMISGELSPENRLLATTAGAVGLYPKPVSQMVARQILQSFRQRARRPVSVFVVDPSPFIVLALKQAMDILRLRHRLARAHRIDEADLAFDVIHFDLIFLDGQLDGGEGLNLLTRMKSFRPSAHIVMFTEDCTMDSVMRARERGADDYLLKTVDLAQLKKVWTRFLAAAREEFLTDL